MKLFVAAELPGDELFGMPVDELPFTFIPAYAQHLDRLGTGTVFLARCERLSACAPVSLWQNRVLRLGRWLSPPMRDGMPLPVGEELAYLETANQFLQSKALCDRLLQPPNQSIFQVAPRVSKKCCFGSYILRLEGRTADDVFASLHAHHRRGIRKARRDGAIVRCGVDQLPIFHRLHAQTMTRSGLPFTSLEEMASLAAALGPKRIICAVSYTPTGEPEGGAFITFTRHSAYFLYGASIERPQVSGAIKLAHWEAIGRCLTRGVRQYDFVGARLRDVSGSKLANIQQFKARFGTQLKKGVLWKADLNRGRTALYDALNEARRGLRIIRHGQSRRMLDIIDQESRFGRRVKGARFDLAPSEHHDSLN